MQTMVNINSNTGKVNKLCCWHPINGKWVWLAQVFDDVGNTEYFVNGVEQKIPSEPPAANTLDNISEKLIDEHSYSQCIEIIEVEEDSNLCQTT